MGYIYRQSHAKGAGTQLTDATFGARVPQVVFSLLGSLRQ
jgi:hypothetical protein